MDFPDPNPVGRDILAGDTPLQFATSTKKKLIRAQRNPMDRCTVVSIYPRDIDEPKLTMYPGQFHIPAGTYEQPGILVVGSSSWWSQDNIDRPIEIIVSSIQVANSIVVDYCNATFGCNMADMMPGLFFILGEVNALEVKMKYKNKLDETKIKQDNWYKNLVKAADSLWARANGNPLAISDDMRLAARSLNLNDKPWLKDFSMTELIRCKFCGGMRNPQFPICPTCKAIDPAHELAKDIKFAV